MIKPSVGAAIKVRVILQIGRLLKNNKRLVDTSVKVSGPSGLRKVVGLGLKAVTRFELSLKLKSGHSHVVGLYVLADATSFTDVYRAFLTTSTLNVVNMLELDEAVRIVVEGCAAADKAYVSSLKQSLANVQSARRALALKQMEASGGKRRSRPVVKPIKNPGA